MTKLESCASCLDFSIDKVIKVQSSKIPSWLLKHDYVKEFVMKAPNQLKKPSKYDTKVELDLGKQYAGKKVLYWGALPKTTSDPTISDAKKAYSNFQNNGVAKIDKNGKVTFFFMCPQVYKTVAKGEKNHKTYFRHLHFCIEKDNSWQHNIYTKIVVCKYDFKKSMDMINSGLYVVINALPHQYYAKDHIPNSYNLFNKDIKKMSVNDLRKWFSEIISLHYPKLDKYIKSKKLDVYEVPIITYCAHSKCIASELALEELMKKGFVNVCEYQGGIQDYRKHIPQDK